MTASPLAKWHDMLKSKDVKILDDILADDAVFYSPVVHTPQQGKAMVKLYLMGADQVLNNGTFKYVKELVDGNQALLEFELEIEGKYINGIDLITWNEDGKITEFKVMLRPLQAVNMVHQKMMEMLEKLKG